MGTLILCSFGINGNIYVHQQIICHFLQGIWLIGKESFSEASVFTRSIGLMITIFVLEPSWEPRNHDSCLGAVAAKTPLLLTSSGLLYIYIYIYW